MAIATITVRKNGSYLVSGAVELRDADGNVYPAKDTVALCRCGASTKKPFCDGTHSKVGFQAAERVCRARPKGSPGQVISACDPARPRQRAAVASPSAVPRPPTPPRPGPRRAALDQVAPPARASGAGSGSTISVSNSASVARGSDPSGRLRSLAIRRSSRGVRTIR
jgi:CDGSH-type Zn-finger protein